MARKDMLSKLGGAPVSGMDKELEEDMMMGEEEGDEMLDEEMGEEEGGGGLADANDEDLIAEVLSRGLADESAFELMGEEEEEEGNEMPDEEDDELDEEY